MMDVLEHVDNDAGLVRHYATKVPSGAHFLVTVPAFRFLWSGHDVFLEHKRRYTLAEIEQTMRMPASTSCAAPTTSASSFRWPPPSASPPAAIRRRAAASRSTAR